MSKAGSRNWEEENRKWEVVETSRKLKKNYEENNFINSMPVRCHGTEQLRW